MDEILVSIIHHEYKRHLLVIIPLLATVLSVSTLSVQVFKGAFAVGIIHRDGQQQRNDKAGLHQEDDRSQKPLSGGFLLEIMMLIYVLMLVSSFGDLVDGESPYDSARASLINWNYLLLLALTPACTLTRGARFRQCAWMHSLLLYVLHCLVNTIAYWKLTLNHGRPPWNSPASQVVLIAGGLLVKRLCEPVIFMARKPVQRASSFTKMHASIAGLATFSWLDPLILQGFRKRLNVTHVWGLLDSETCQMIVARVQYRQESASLHRHLFFSMRHNLAIQCFWAVIASLTSYVPTMAMRSIVNHIEDASIGPRAHLGWLELCILLVAGTIHAIASGQIAWLGDGLKLTIRNIINSAIYQQIMKRKALSSSSSGPACNNSSLSQASDGTIINLVSSDVEKIADAGASAYEVLTAIPIRVAIALYMLYRLLGLSSLAGVLVMLAITPMNSLIFKHMGRAVVKAVETTDVRVQETDRLLQNVRTIKLFAWEDFFHSKLHTRRSEELAALSSRLSWWSIMATVWYVVPSFIAFAAIFTYTAIHQQSLPPSTAFTAVSLFNLLKTPLDQLVGMSAKIQESLLSLHRVEALLGKSEIGMEHQPRYKVDTPRDQEDVCGFRNATLSWDDSRSGFSPSSGFRLHNTGLFFSAKGLNIVAGPTGCGKSSLLLGLLGEMNLKSGVVYAPKDHASYCAQEVWLINDTIKRNIVFGTSWDAKRYQTVIHACALAQDLAAFEHGDTTMVGEKGAALSGGQKQRVALARAVYSNSRTVVLDDCLSAVDSNTARWLVAKCLKGPLMNGRTCIIATHHVSLLLPHATSITILSRGNIVASGSPSQLRGSASLTHLLKSSQSGGDIQSDERQLSTESQVAPIDVPDESSVHSNIVQSEPSEIMSPGNNASELAIEQDQATSLHDTGDIALSVVMKYLSSMGGRLFWSLMIVLFSAQQLTAIALNLTLQGFTNAYSQNSLSGADGNTAKPDITPDRMSFNGKTTIRKVWHHLALYAAMLLLYTLVNFGRLHAASVGSLSASKIMHERLLHAVLHSRFQFFDRTSHGMLMRLFAQDIQTVDSNVMPMALGTLHFLVTSAFTMALITVMIPRFFVPGVAMMAAYFVVGQLFLNSSRQLERIKSQQHEKLYQHISDSLRGAITIRAFGQERHFEHELYARLDMVNRPARYLGAVDHWLAFRLSVIGTLMAFIAGYFALSSVGKISAGAIGLTLNYTMTFSENIMWTVRYHALNQQNFSAVERIDHVNRLAPEGTEQNATRLSKSWPPSGSISFRQYSTRYHKDQPEVLKNLSFEVKPFERIGVVGRTGAGKSSLALSILRALEATKGSIEIDGVDISTVQLHELRRAVCLVPQDPMLFVGNLRDNLDPYGDFTDDQISRALVEVGLVSSQHTPSAPGECELSVDDNLTTGNMFANLAMPIEDSGTNMSLGQRQLLCLARALLRRPKIVILDEATASIDLVTDQQIRECVSKIEGTVITIAHRLTSIIDHDQVLVMDNGEARQIGHPWELLQRGGLFRSLCEAYDNIKDLESEAKTAWDTARQKRRR